MSESIAKSVISRINLQAVAVSEAHQTLVADLGALMEADKTAETAEYADRCVEVCEAFGFSGAEQRKIFPFANGIAFIPVTGTLINRFGQCYGYVTGYNYIRKVLNAALADPDVLGIVMDLNSPGGEVAGCFEVAADIYNAREIKPILGVVDSNCYSACYAIGSACSKLIAIPSAGVGSIGVLSVHLDASEFYKKWGLTFELIHSGKHKVDGNMFEKLSPNVRADVQSRIDKIRVKFADTVAKHRNLEATVVMATEARCYQVEEALERGLIDGIAPAPEAVTNFLNELNNSDEETTISTTTQQPVAAAPAASTQTVDAAAVVTAERARISGIIGCDEAKARPALANHLALSTDMSLDAAKGILSASAVETPAAKEDDGKDKKTDAASTTTFQNVMDAAKHPNVPESASTATGGDDAAEDDVAKILGAQNQACGTNYKAQ